MEARTVRSSPHRHRTYTLCMGMLLVAYLFALLPAGLSWSEEATHSALEGSWALKLQWTPTFMVATVVLYRAGLASWVHQLRLNPMVPVVLLYCLVTLLWSPLPVSSMKRLVQLAGVMVMCLCVVCVARPSTLQWIRLTLLVMFVLLVASVVVVVVNPTVGKESVANLAGSWRGVMAQKNGFGMVISLAFIFGVFHCLRETTRPGHIVVGLALILLCFAGAKSSTSITVAAMATCVYLLIRKEHLASTQWRLRILAAVATVALIGFQAFFIVNSRPPQWGEIMNPVAGIFGKSADLTGRTDIWQYMWPVIDRHWISGIGYGAFWLGPGSPAQVVLDELDWTPNQSHDGYIDITNELGVIGLTLVFGMVLMQIANLWALSRIDRDRAAMHAALLVIILFSNITESSLLQPLHIFNIMLMLSCFMVNQLLWNHRHHLASP